MSDKNIAIPNPEDIPSMTPGQLLAPADYAVVCFVDGKIGWMFDSFAQLDDATRVAERSCKAMKVSGYDYRVVRIKHAN